MNLKKKIGYLRVVHLWQEQRRSDAVSSLNPARWHVSSIFSVTDVLLTLVMWPRWFLPRFFAVKLLFSSILEFLWGSFLKLCTYCHQILHAFIHSFIYISKNSFFAILLSGFNTLLSSFVLELQLPHFWPVRICSSCLLCHLVWPPFYSGFCFAFWHRKVF